MLPTSTVFLFLLLLFLSSVKCLLCARNRAEFLSEISPRKPEKEKTFPSPAEEPSTAGHGARAVAGTEPRPRRSAFGGGWAPPSTGLRRRRTSVPSWSLSSSSAVPSLERRRKPLRPTGPSEVWPERLCLPNRAGTPSGGGLPRSPLLGALPRQGRSPLHSPPSPLEGAFATPNHVVIRSYKNQRLHGSNAFIFLCGPLPKPSPCIISSRV